MGWVAAHHRPVCFGALLHEQLVTREAAVPCARSLSLPGLSCCWVWCSEGKELQLLPQTSSAFFFYSWLSLRQGLSLPYVPGDFQGEVGERGCSEFSVILLTWPSLPCVRGIVHPCVIWAMKLLLKNQPTLQSWRYFLLPVSGH